MKNPLRRLHTRLMLIGATAIAVAALSFTAYIAREVSTLSNDAFRKEAIRLSQSIAESIGDELVLENYANVEDRLRHFTQIDLVESSTLASPSGTILMRIVQPQAGGTAEAIYGGSAVVPADARVAVEEAPDRLMIWRPVGTAVPPLAWLRIDYSLDGPKAMRRHILFDGLLFALPVTYYLAVHLNLL